MTVRSIKPSEYPALLAEVRRVAAVEEEERWRAKLQASVKEKATEPHKAGMSR